MMMLTCFYRYVVVLETHLPYTPKTIFSHIIRFVGDGFRSESSNLNVYLHVSYSLCFVDRAS